MSTISRTLANLWKVGPKNAWRQMQYIGDTKAGVLIGTDRYGNKFYENTEELPLRTRWVDYKSHDFDAGQIEPGWHAWISYMVDKPPTEDKLMQRQGGRVWENNVPQNLTMTRGAYKPYNTVRPKIASWDPKPLERK